MASLTSTAAPTAFGAARPKSTANCIYNTRFKPFIAVRNSRAVSSAERRRLLGVPKAAEAAASAPAPDEGEGEDLEFNYSEAKKNNSYQPSDVENALNFYLEGTGVQPAADAEFVTNVFGVEDADCFQDLDNNEGYQADEFLAAGIPEAAPKKQRRPRFQDGSTAGDEDGDDQQRLKDAEDRMLLEAQMEALFGKDYDKEEESSTSTTSQTRMWNWLASDSASPKFVHKLASSRTAAARRVASHLPSEAALLADIANAAQYSQYPEAADAGWLAVAADEDLGELLKEDNADGVAEDPAEGVAERASKRTGTSKEEIPDIEPLSEATIARIDALLAEEIPDFDLDPSLIVSSSPQPLEPPASQQVMDEYLARLKKDIEDGIELEEARAMVGDGALELVDIKPDADPTTDALLQQAAELPDLAPLSEDEAGLKEADELAMSLKEEVGYSISDIRADLRAFEKLPKIADDDDGIFLSQERLQHLKNELAQAEAMLEEEEQQRKVAGDSAEQEAPLYLERTLQGDTDEDGTDAEDYAGTRFDRVRGQGQWSERIVELTRVTKVVKGGKIMGFRCVAAIGNGQGLVGVGCQAGRDVQTAVKRALVNAQKNIIQVPLVGAGTIPHRVEMKYHAARIVLVPAADGTGCIAGGAVRSVLELAGVQNILAKRLGSRSALNNARCTIKALESLRTLNEVAKARNVPLERLLL